ncbi:MAG: hypothetical protein A2W90_03490 [Bacteroidetes bacterium GWF2_42_66]|nr:MAG: hypothetical protein A2W92_18410 [Bacteroidetes bacterium GWA2_42_15]OFY41297.1 MAG: hypothetical protein A2W90_03490 [Bacteroidetes bacterium GWF2_42_66]HBL75510.1 hypothetical protein [Prolixibacteraceae bacterium]HCU60581.1 hypothetical protein [Prolixibacteraceae bacterium]
MKKTSVLFLIWGFCVATVFSQEQSISKLMENFHLSASREKGGMGNQLDYSNIPGTPFFNDNFKKGEVTTTSNTVVSNVPLRYNVYADEIEFEEESKKTFYLDKSTVKSVKIGDSEFIYKAYSMNNKLGRSYFEVLLQGKATLLKQYRVQFEEAKPAKAYEDPTPAQFKSATPEFYIAFGDAEADRISSSKQLTEILSDKKTEVAEYMKKNKLKIGNQEDIIRIIQFYNTGK